MLKTISRGYIHFYVQSASYKIIDEFAKITLYDQNYTTFSEILAGNQEIRFTRKFEIRGILQQFSVPNNCVTRGPPVTVFYSHE